MKECCCTGGSNSQPPEYHSDEHSTELPGPLVLILQKLNASSYFERLLSSHKSGVRLNNFVTVYRKTPKFSDTPKITVIILKFEYCGLTIE